MLDVLASCHSAITFWFSWMFCCTACSSRFEYFCSCRTWISTISNTLMTLLPHVTVSLMSVFERTLVDVWLKLKKENVVNCYWCFIVHLFMKKERQYIKAHVCELNFNTLHVVLINKSKIWRFCIPPPSLNYLTKVRPEFLRWLDNGFMLVRLKWVRSHFSWTTT